MPFDATTPPTPQELEEASKVALKDEAGKVVHLGELYKDQKTIVLFIRHFYCGLCQEYLQFLTQKVKPEMLASAGVKLVVIGCGEWSLIKEYRNLLDCPFEVYADGDKKSYVALGMTRRTLEQGEPGHTAEYLKRGAVGNVMASIGNAFKMGKLFAKSGDIKQLGGEFVFGPGNEVVFTHRMEHTKDHVPTATLMQAAGVPYSG